MSIRKNGVFQYTTIILLSILYIGFLVLVGSLRHYIENPLREYINGIIGIVFGILFFHLTCMVFQFLGLKLQNNEFKDKDLLKKRILIGLVLSIIFAFSTTAIYGILDNEVALSLGFFLPSLGQAAFVLRPAIIEEIVFRHTLLNVFIQKKKKYLGLIITASIFGAIHILNVFFGSELNWIHIGATVIGGLVLGLMYMNFGLIPVIILHYIIDITGNGSIANLSLFFIVMNIIGALFVIGMLTFYIKNSRIDNKIVFIKT